MAFGCNGLPQLGEVPGQYVWLQRTVVPSGCANKPSPKHNRHLRSETTELMVSSRTSRSRRSSTSTGSSALQAKGPITAFERQIGSAAIEFGTIRWE
jgi:hypothetical protein